MNLLSLPRPVRPALISLLLAIGCFVGPGAFAAAPKLELPPLAGDGQLRPGKFVWADLVTDDVAATRRFYGHMFGWTFRAVGEYTIAAVDGRPLGGMVQRPRPTDRPAQPRWIGFLSVANVAETSAAVVRAGGKVLLAPRTPSPRGEQAVLADAEGVVFGVIRSATGDPADTLADPGEWIWMQLLSRDARKAGEFYKAVGGYELWDNQDVASGESIIFASGGYARAAVRKIPTDAAVLLPTWLPFVRVTSMAGAVTRATELVGRC